MEGKFLLKPETRKILPLKGMTMETNSIRLLEAIDRLNKSYRKFRKAFVAHLLIEKSLGHGQK